LGLWKLKDLTIAEAKCLSRAESLIAAMKAALRASPHSGRTSRGVFITVCGRLNHKTFEHRT